MQLKSKIHVNRYLIGTTVNVLLIGYVFPIESYIVIFTFFCSVLLNQYFLAVIVADVTGVEKNTGLIPTSVCTVLKLLTLLLGFYYAMSNTVKMEFFLVSIYIFQLIILVISTKRIVKKN